MLPSLARAVLAKVIVVALVSLSFRALPLASASSPAAVPRGAPPGAVRLSCTV